MALGAGVGAAVGSPKSTEVSAARQLARIMTATRASGTARFTFSEVGTSTNASLRSSEKGLGVVDFATDSLRVSQRDRNTEFTGTSTTAQRAVTEDTSISNIWIGRTDYLEFHLAGALPRPVWIKQATWPRSSFGPLGPLGQIGPLGELTLDLSVPGLRLQDQGATVVRGIPATAYLVVVPTCARRPAGIASTSSSPLEVWVDGRDRMVQARVTTRVDFTEAMLRADHLNGPLAGAGETETGRATDVSTIELADFGAPADIAAPPVPNRIGAGSSSSIEMKLKGCT